MKYARVSSLLVAVALVLALLPGPALADDRAGRTVVVEEGETVEGDLSAVGGSVVVRGHVTGDVEAVAGSVVVTGTVDGDVTGAAGSVRIDGTVGGRVRVAAGSLWIGSDAMIDGDVDAAVGSATIAGTVGGTVRIGADSIDLRPSAVVEGDLAYEGTLEMGEGATVEGTVREDPDLVFGPGVRLPTVPPGVGLLYGFLAHLLLGAVLLLAFPLFSSRTVDRALDDPLRSGGVGLLLLVGIPVVAVLVMLTVVGIPFGLLGLGLYALLLWVGFVYGAFALGSLALSRVGREHRWGALALGLAVLVALQWLPVLGGLLRFVALVAGFGALLRGLYEAYEVRRGRRSVAGRAAR